MVRMVALLLAALAAIACGDDEATPSDDATAASDGPAPDASPDAGVCLVSPPTCAPIPWPAPDLCATAVPLTAAQPLTAQDSATGGFGDCAASGSGIGGPALYYDITIPAGRITRVRAVPADIATDGLLRVLPDCDSTAAAESDRGGALTDGRATLCLTNATATDRLATIAASRYSGELDCLPLVFDLSLEVRAPNDGCQTD